MAEEVEVFDYDVAELGRLNRRLLPGQRDPEEVDLAAYLEDRKVQVAAVQEAAAIAREQALALLRLQRRIADIDDLAHGAGNGVIDGPNDFVGHCEPAAPSSPRGARDRRDVAPTSPTVGSSLSAEDRLRFGLSAGAGGQLARLPPKQEDGGLLEEIEGLAQERLRLLEIEMQQDAQALESAPVVWPVQPRPAERTIAQPPPASQSWRQEGICEAQHGHGAVRLPGAEYDFGREVPVEELPSWKQIRGPSWSSLTADDRRRFGLDSGWIGQPRPSSPVRYVPVDWTESVQVPTARFSPRRAKRDVYDSDQPRLWQGEAGFVHHPDVLWGTAGLTNDGVPDVSMSRTMAQLEAVGMTCYNASLQESEQRLQMVKLG